VEILTCHEFDVFLGVSKLASYAIQEGFARSSDTEQSQNTATYRSTPLVRPTRMRTFGPNEVFVTISHHFRNAWYTQPSTAIALS